jgi:hypothetical protein
VPAAPSLWHFHKGDHDTAYRAAKAYAEKQRAAKTPAPVTDPGPEYEFTSTAGSTCFYRAARGEVQFRAKLGAWIPYAQFVGLENERKLWTSAAYHKAARDAEQQKAAR